MKKVKLEERLMVNLELQFPDINEDKSYDSMQRKFKLFVDNEAKAEFDQTHDRRYKMHFHLRSVIKVVKVYGDKYPDSIFTYRVGENFAMLQDQKGESKKIAISFEIGNILKIKTDRDFNRLKDISE